VVLREFQRASGQESARLNREGQAEACPRSLEISTLSTTGTSSPSTTGETRAEGVPAKRAVRTSKKAAAELAPPPHLVLLEKLVGVIDDAKAEEIVSLDLAGKTSLADAMIVASGRSDRHVGAIAERVASSLRDMGLPPPRMEGMTACDWVLIDTGDIIIHLFRPEVRSFYNLEKLWGAGRPSETPVVPADPAAPAKPARPKRTLVRTDGDEPKPRARRKPAGA
jgi:ribosome-associated protein